MHGKSKLLRLNLRENELEDKGAATVVKGLAGNTTLQVGSIPCSIVWPQDVVVLVALLCSGTALLFWGKMGAGGTVGGPGGDAALCDQPAYLTCKYCCCMRCKCFNIIQLLHLEPAATVRSFAVR